MILHLDQLGNTKKTERIFHLLFDVGPQYYFDTNGNGNTANYVTTELRI
jgi:hypothetical protein